MQDPRPYRDHRIDLFRGLALVMIFINHIPQNPLSIFTSRNFGFSDAAEAFVLLSGISAGLAYSSRKTFGNTVFSLWSRAFTLWWVQCAIVISIYVMVRLTVDLQGIAELAEQRNVRPVLEDPLGLLAPLLLLTHQFNCADILPLYILLLIVSPVLLFVARTGAFALVAGSAALWLSAGLFEINLRTFPTDRGWFFNPLSWQFLFAIGLIIGSARSRSHVANPVNWAILLMAVAFLGLSGLWMLSPTFADLAWTARWSFQTSTGSPDFLVSFEKTYLPPLRLIHILALAYVLASIPVLHRVARDHRAKALLILGRNALPAFASGTILVYLIQILREVILPPTIVDIAFTVVGLNIMLLVAIAFDRRRPRTAASGSADKSG